MEQRRRKHLIMLIHQAAFIVIISIHIAVGQVVDILVVGRLPSGSIHKGLNALENHLVEQVALVIIQTLDAIVFGNDQALRPIDINRFLSATKNRLQFGIINNTFIAQTRVI